MTPERWLEVRKLFDTIVETPAEARAPLLDEACRNDPELRREVENLLASHQQRDPALDTLGEDEFVGMPDMDLAMPSAELYTCPQCGADNSPDSNFCQQCGNRLSKMSTLALTADDEDPESPATREIHRGDVVNERYTILELIGRGGMGVVYRATDQKTNSPVAIKFLKLSNEQRIAAFKRFSREIRIAKTLDHANLVRLLAAGSWEGKDFLVMEYVSGETLKDRILRKKVGDTRSILSIVIQICDALQAAHDSGVVHRDVKPSNVLLDKKGKVKICDFGLAFTEGKDMTRITRTGDCMGTPEYMAPEQIEGRRVDSRADIYAIGVVMYEVFTGEAPFRGNTPMSIVAQHLQRSPVPPSRLNPRLPSHIERAIMKCLEKDPNRRYQAVSEVRRALIRGAYQRVREEHPVTGDISDRGRRDRVRVGLPEAAEIP